jgi:hypothetical protein
MPQAILRQQAVEAAMAEQADPVEQAQQVAPPAAQVVQVLAAVRVL